MSAGETDDLGFIEVLNAVVNELIADQAPKQFWVIQIDNSITSGWDFQGAAALRQTFRSTGTTQ
jgi:hypothetical protein